MLRKARSIALVCLVVAACSAPAAIAPTSTPEPPGSTEVPSPSPTSPAASRLPMLDATFEPGASPGTGAIEVQLGTCCQLRFVPSTLTARAGTVSMFLTNIPNADFPYPHDLKIGTEIGRAIAGSPVLKNGESGLFTIEDLPAGSYVFWCAVDQHYLQGMDGALTVTP